MCSPGNEQNPRRLFLALWPEDAERRQLAELAAQLGYICQIEPDPIVAIQQAVAAAHPSDLLCIAGSIFLVGDLLNRWESLQSTLALFGNSTK